MNLLSYHEHCYCQSDWDRLFNCYVSVRGSSPKEAAVSLLDVRDFKRCSNLHDGVGVLYVHYCLGVHTDPQCTAMLVQRTGSLVGVRVHLSTAHGIPSQP